MSVEGKSRRRAGAKAKRPRMTAAEAIQEVFELLGGHRGLLAWASGNEANRSAFYTRIWPKLLAVQTAAALAAASPAPAEAAAKPAEIAPRVKYVRPIYDGPVSSAIREYRLAWLAAGNPPDEKWESRWNEDPAVGHEGGP